MAEGFRPGWSAYQVNLFLDEPALWLMERFMKVRSTAGASAWRGKAVEAAADLVLFQKADDDAALARAYEVFELDAQGEISDEIEKARGEIAPMLRNLIPSLRELGVPFSRQAKFTVDVPGVDIQVYGYVDYRFTDWLMDLKSTGKMPSLFEDGRIKDKAEHLRAMAIYERGLGLRPVLCYVTPGKPDKGKDRKEPLFYTPHREELDASWRMVEAALRAMERIQNAIEGGREIGDVAMMYPPRDLAGFRWSDATRSTATKLWNLGA